MQPEPVLTMSEKYSREYLADVLTDPMYLAFLAHLKDHQQNLFRELLKKGGMPEVQNYCLDKYQEAVGLWGKCKRDGMSQPQADQYIMDNVICPESELDRPLEPELNPWEMKQIQDYLDEIEQIWE